MDLSPRRQGRKERQTKDVLWVDGFAFCQAIT
jgi:hypothetical protein